ncbi:MAG: hypothetical protein HOP11_02430 [Saprospiraceae bacterium]|nr:hypothetical protein [Saprospiraceae bacterium]
MPRLKRNAFRLLVFIKRIVQSFALLLGLLVILFLLFNSSSFLNWSKSRILTLLKDEIENKIEYSSLDFNFFNGANVKELLIYDHKEDTLFYSKNVRISFAKSLISLFKNELSFNQLDLTNSELFMTHYEGDDDNSLDIFLRQFKKSKTSNSDKLAFNLKEVNLSQFTLLMKDNRLKNENFIFIKEAAIDVNDMNLSARFADIHKIEITSPVIRILQQGKDSSRPKTTIVNSIDSLCRDVFALSCKNLKVSNASILFSNDSQFAFDSVGSTYFNPEFFRLDDVQLDIENYNMLGGQIIAKEISSNALVNKSLSINSFSLDGIRYMNDEFVVEKIKILTDDSHIGDSLSIQLGKNHELQQILDEAFLQFLLRDTRISCKDLLYFIPFLRQNKFLSNNPELSVELAGSFFGTLNNLKVFDLAVDIPNRLEFKGDISTRDLTKRGEELVNLEIKHLVSSSDFVQSLIPALSKVQIFNKIGSFKYTGRFDGFIEDFVSDGTFYSDLGVLKSDIRLNLRPGTDKATWAGDLSLKDFALGKLFNVPGIGNVTMDASIEDGLGLHIDKMSANLNAEIYSVELNQYNYQNIQIDAEINRNLFDGEALIQDKNLDVVFKGRISDLSKVPRLNFTADIKKVDLKALNLSNNSYIVSAKLESDITDLDFDKLTGTMKVSKGLIYDYANNRVLNVGDLSLSQNRSNNKASTVLKSEIVDIDIQGDYKLTTAYNQIITYFNDQYPEIFSNLGMQYKEDRNPLIIVGQIDVKAFNRISSFLELGIRTDLIQSNFKIDNVDKISIANINAGKINYKNITLEQVEGNLLGDPNHFDGMLVSDKLLINDKLFLRSAKLVQSFENSIMRFKLSANDTIDVFEKYRVNIASEKAGTNKKFYFEGDEILVNGYPWQYDKNASFEIGKKYISLTDFYFKDSISEVRIDDINNTGLLVEIKSFDLATINPILKSPSLNFAGRFDLSVKANNIFNLDKGEGNIQISNMRINKVNYGRFYIDFAMDNIREPWKINVKNQYKETDIDVRGTLNIPLSSDYSLPKYDFNLKGRADGFQLYFLESFITNISQTRGTLSGPIAIYRENKKVFLDGDFMSSDASTKVNYLNTTYKFSKQRIVFSRNEILFDNNTLQDELNNPIIVNGKIIHNNLSTFALQVSLSSRKALVLNTSRTDNLYYYGYGMMDFQCSFNGPTSKIDMDFKGRSEKGSKFVIPVRFDQESPDIKFVKFRVADTVANIVPAAVPIVIKGMNIRMDIELTEDCEMSIIFDEKNGDILKGNGFGNIQVESLRNNTFSIKGNYEISSGQYLFTLFNFVNKPFKLKKGGSILWTGDPLDATINIEANYEGLSVSPHSLIEEYVSGNPSLELEAKERSRVDLTMIMKGSLLKPDIGFKLGYPYLTGQLRNFADTKIRLLEQNPQQINQQVASLIIFRTFVATNNSGFSDPNLLRNTGLTTGISTISEFLSNQVSIFVSNLLAEVLYSGNDIVSGVDFNVNVDPSKNILGTETNSNEVTLNLKHHLWNDEWAVTIGANFGNNSAYNQNNYVNSESSIEWNTPVPGLRMRIYYRGVNGVDGLRHRVGTGINYRKEFNSLDEMRFFFREKNKKKGVQGEGS